MLRKSPVADLGAIASDAGVPWIGNLEALALGPRIADMTGNDREQGRLLLVVADDNFGAGVQKTGSRVLALRLLDR